MSISKIYRYKNNKNNIYRDKSFTKYSKLLKGGSSLPAKQTQQSKVQSTAKKETPSTTKNQKPSTTKKQKPSTTKKQVLNNKFIHPICYNKNTGENSFEKIFNKRKNEPNTRILFIYNEDFTEYSNEDLIKGGGNGAYRPNRKDLSDVKLGKTGINGYIDNMHTLGIPMGSHHAIDKSEIINSNPYKLVNNFTKIDIFKKKFKNYIEKNEFLELSIQNIYSYVLKNNITDIYYSSGSCDKDYNIIKNVDYKMGLDIFIKYKWTQQNKPNLDIQFKNLIDSLKKEGYNISNDNGTYVKPVTPQVTPQVKPPVTPQVKPQVKPVIPPVTQPVTPVTNKSFTNIGWDFDGVLHLEVTPLLNNNDSRHPYDNTFKGNGHTVQNHKLFEELFQKVIIPLNKSNQCIITANTHLDVIKKYKYNTQDFINIFKYGIVNSFDKIKELQTKKINYFFDDSNKNILDVYKSWFKGGLSDLQKLYKVIPESIYDIYDHKNNPSDANGTLNPPIVEILKTNENIKILTYNIRYDINDGSAVNVYSILKKSIEVEKVDFICLQEFAYVDTIPIIDKDGKPKSKTFDIKNKKPFDKLNTKTGSKINDNNYSYVYNIQNPEMQFTFYDKTKYKIIKDKDNKQDLIIRGRLSYNDRPYTLIVFNRMSTNQNIVLINVHFPHIINSKGILTTNDLINDRILFYIKGKNKENIKPYLEKSRIIMAGDFNRTIYSIGTNGKANVKIDNSVYGLKLFKGLFDNINKSIIMYNIPPDINTFKTDTYPGLGHIDNVLDSFGLQFNYEYDKRPNASDHFPVLVTLLAANPIYDLFKLQNELSPSILSTVPVVKPTPVAPVVKPTQVPVPPVVKPTPTPVVKPSPTPVVPVVKPTPTPTSKKKVTFTNKNNNIKEILQSKEERHEERKKQYICNKQKYGKSKFAAIKYPEVGHIVKYIYYPDYFYKIINIIKEDSRCDIYIENITDYTQKSYRVSPSECIFIDIDLESSSDPVLVKLHQKLEIISKIPIKPVTPVMPPVMPTTSTPPVMPPVIPPVIPQVMPPVMPPVMPTTAPSLINTSYCY